MPELKHQEKLEQSLKKQAVKLIILNATLLILIEFSTLIRAKAQE